VIGWTARALENKACELEDIFDTSFEPLSLFVCYPGRRLACVEPRGIRGIWSRIIYAQTPGTHRWQEDMGILPRARAPSPYPLRASHLSSLGVVQGGTRYAARASNRNSDNSARTPPGLRTCFDIARKGICLRWTHPLLRGARQHGKDRLRGDETWLGLPRARRRSPKD
jgi:hypothetical protein